MAVTVQWLGYGGIETLDIIFHFKDIQDIASHYLRFFSNQAQNLTTRLHLVAHELQSWIEIKIY